MIEVSRVDKEQLFSENHVAQYLMDSQKVHLLINLLVSKENIQQAVNINIKTKVSNIRKGTPMPPPLIELELANNIANEYLTKSIFQLLSIDESTPNKYNKVAALLEEFDTHGFVKIYNTLVDLSSLSGDIETEGEEE